MDMDDQSHYRDAIRMGLRRAGLHWIRASYEVVAGMGAFLDEIAQARREEPHPDEGDTGEPDGPVRIELD